MEETQEQVQEMAPEISPEVKEMLKVSEMKAREIVAEIREPAIKIFQDQIKLKVPGEMFDEIAANAVGVAADAFFDFVVNQVIDKISKDV